MNTIIVNSVLKIAIVEDDLIFTKVIQQELKKLGYMDVFTFETGEDFFAHKSSSFDVVLLDYHLDGVKNGAINGLEVLKKIKHSGSKSHIVMLSANDDVKIAQDALLNGAFEYIVKSKSASVRLELSLNSIKLTMAQSLKIAADKKSMIITIIVFIGILIGIVMANMFF